MAALGARPWLFGHPAPTKAVAAVSAMVIDAPFLSWRQKSSTTRKNIDEM